MQLPKYSLEAARERATLTGLGTRIREHLQFLGAADREILYQRYALRMTLGEISEKLQLSPDQVEKVLEKARRM